MVQSLALILLPVFVILSGFSMITQVVRIISASLGAFGTVFITLKKMFNLDEGKIECAVGNREICVWQSKKAEIDFISDVGICGIYLSLALGTAKFKQLD